MSTPAERLIAAANLLEKRAGEATEGPWNVDGPWWWDDTCAAVVSAGLSREAVVIAPKGSTDVDARYIATMHPEVGKAVAAWLRRTGEQAEEGLVSDSAECSLCADGHCGGHSEVWYCTDCDRVLLGADDPNGCGHWTAPLALADVLLAGES